MILLNKYEWEIAAWLTASAALTAIAAWLVFRRRPSAEELERARRDYLRQKFGPATNSP